MKDGEKGAQQNFAQYLNEGLIKKEKSDAAQSMYIKNADLSLNLAKECIESSLKPYLWVVVISYYSMFYIANAVLLELGYKIGEKIAHKVTNDALIVLVKDKVKKGLGRIRKCKRRCIRDSISKIRRNHQALRIRAGQKIKIPV